MAKSSDCSKTSEMRSAQAEWLKSSFDLGEMAPDGLRMPLRLSGVSFTLIWSGTQVRSDAILLKE
jgi:hypothetical protein